jgi:hypothetical protein
MDWQEKIISLYLEITELSQSTLQYFYQRFSNNNKPEFTDEEIITIYLFGIQQGYRNLKQIYNHTKSYWLEFFPKLPSYSAFNRRVNRLGSAFSVLAELYQNQYPKEVFDHKHFRVIDSMPIVMAKQGRRFKAKIAPDVADKGGYCATKKLHYYGVKLHIVGSYTKGKMPIAEYVGLTHAGMHDSKAYEQIMDIKQLQEYEKFADKAYPANRKTKLYVPIKKTKGQENLDAADQLYSTAISRIRQPIESFNNWLEEKTGIQVASKVRSTAGLMVHVFGRIATAFEIMRQKLCQ